LPLVTELYNAKNELVQLKAVLELRLNQGLPDELFNLVLPPDNEVQDKTKDIMQI